MPTRPVIGLLGGMGPGASAEFYRRLVVATPAQRDQDHLHVLIDSDPSVPDRTEALLHGGPSPVPTLRRMIARLTAAGADLLVMACNTASAFLPELTDATPVPIVDWVEVVAAGLSRAAHSTGTGGTTTHHDAGTPPTSLPAVTSTSAGSPPPPAPPVAVLATDGTQASGLYHAALARHGLTVAPTATVQPEVMAIIRARKAGVPVTELAPRLDHVVSGLTAAGVGPVLLACTELSELHRSLITPAVDAMDVVIAYLMDRVTAWAT